MRTAQFQETDRVPLYDLLRNDAVIEHYTGQKLTVDNGERLTWLAIGHTLDMVRSSIGPQQPGYVRWENGIVFRQERWTKWVVERPFHDMPGLLRWIKEQIKRSQATVYDQAYADQFHDSVRQWMAVFAAGDPMGRNDPTVYVPVSMAGLTRMYQFTGMDMFAYFMFDYPDLLEEWLDARNQAELRRVAAIANPDLMPIVLVADDIAFRTGPLFSPDWLRRYWIPCLKRLIDAWHTHDTLCLFHSDGNLWRIMDDLVAAGIDGLNPIEVVAGMTVKEVRQRYPHLFLAGGIDVSQLLVNGSPEEVRAACLGAIAGTDAIGYWLMFRTSATW
jgi:hypothetical protein